MCDLYPQEKGPRTFSRMDNPRLHIRLHTRNGSKTAKRTPYYQDAQAYLDNLDANKKKRAKKPSSRGERGVESAA